MGCPEMDSAFLQTGSGRDLKNGATVIICRIRVFEGIWIKWKKPAR